MNIFKKIKNFKYYFINDLEYLYQNKQDQTFVKIIKKKGKNFFLNFSFNNSINSFDISENSKKFQFFNKKQQKSKFSILHQVIFDDRQELFAELYVNLNFFKDKEVLNNNNNSLNLTPLQFACTLNSLVFFQALIEMGADTESKGMGNMSLVHLAAYGGSVNCMDFLLYYKKINLNTTTDEKLTPLHFSAKYDKIDMTNYLIDNQADIYARDSEGLTPLEYCVLGDNVELMNILVEHHYDLKLVSLKGEKSLSLIHLAASNKQGTKCLKELLKNPENLNLYCNDILYSTPLHFAVLAQNLKGVELLVRCGANMDLTDYLGNTPLHYACDLGNIKIVRLLVEFGSNIHKKNKEGISPNQIAISTNDEKLSEIRLFFLGLSSSDPFSKTKFDFKQGNSMY